MAVTNSKLCEVLAVVVLVAVGCSGLQWPQGCDQYVVSHDTEPQVLPIYSDIGWYTVSQCQQLCTTRTDCGGFVVNEQYNDRCMLYNINNQLLRDYFNASSSPVAWKTWMKTGQKISRTWYSKTCNYDVDARDADCNVYSYVHPRSAIIVRDPEADPDPSNLRYIITLKVAKGEDEGVMWCLRWCTVYSECRSVAYVHLQEHGALCALYNTTISHLLETGRRDHVRYQSNLDVRNYDRSCACPRYTPNGRDRENLGN